MSENWRRPKAPPRSRGRRQGADTQPAVLSLVNPASPLLFFARIARLPPVTTSSDLAPWPSAARAAHDESKMACGDGAGS